MIAQRDLFDSTTTSTAVVGLMVARACRCGSIAATIGSSSGPHHARLVCAECGSFREWLPGAAFRFITEIVDRLGRPTEPFVIRDPSSEATVTAAMSPQSQPPTERN